MQITPQLNMSVFYHPWPRIVFTQSYHWRLSNAIERGADILLLLGVNIFDRLFMFSDWRYALEIIVALLELGEWGEIEFFDAGN